MSLLDALRFAPQTRSRGTTIGTRTGGRQTKTPNVRPYIVLTSVTLATLIGAGCKGERPALTPQAGPAVAASNDPAVIAVANQLAAAPVQFTAQYTITPTAADAEPVTATVLREGLRQHVTVGDVDIFVSSDGGVSCTNAMSECIDGVNDGPLSNLNITHEFWGPSAQRRLLTDDARKIGATEGSETSIAGTDATCVAIPLAGPSESGTVEYCAADNGVLGSYVGPDAMIELTGFEPSVDENALTVPPLNPEG